MNMAVIFDLDMTLIDSARIEPLRRARNWGEVYKRIPELMLYSGANELIRYLSENNIKTAIVTASPRPYCQRVLDHFGLKVDTTVCYHDTANHKPHPEPINKALSLLGVDNNRAIAIGDAHKDIVAAKSAGVVSVAALWGAANPQETLLARPDHQFGNLSDLGSFLRKHFSL